VDALALWAVLWLFCVIWLTPIFLLWAIAARRWPRIDAPRWRLGLAMCALAATLSFVFTALPLWRDSAAALRGKGSVDIAEFFVPFWLWSWFALWRPRRRRKDLPPGVFANLSAARGDAIIGRHPRLVAGALVLLLLPGPAAITALVSRVTYDRFRPRTDGELAASWSTAVSVEDDDGIPMEDWPAALRASEELLKRHPGDTAFSAWIERRGTARVAVGDTLGGLQDLVASGARSGCGDDEAPRRLLGAPPLSRRAASAVWEWVAACAERRADFRRARDIYDSLIERDHDHDVYYRRAMVRFALGDTLPACADRRRDSTARAQRAPSVAVATSSNPSIEALCTSAGWGRRTVDYFARRRGTVKWLNNRGVGFIVPAVQGPDVFFHVAEVEGHAALAEHDSVEYELQESSRGASAVRIKRLP
jgi:cold shock CspA family protein